MAAESHLENLILTILSNDNEKRRASENIFQSFVDCSPSAYLESSLNLLQTSQSPLVRSFCAVSLQKSFHSQQPPPDPETISKTNAKLFFALEKEFDPSIRHKIINLITNLISDNEEILKSVTPILISMLESEEMRKKEAGYLILGKTFEFSSEIFENYKFEIHRLIKQGISNENITIKLAALQTLTNYVCNFSSRHVKEIENMAEMLIDATEELLQNDYKSGEEALKLMETIAESEPKFYRKIFPHLFNVLMRICSIKDPGTTKISLEILLALAERLPHLYRTNHSFLSLLVHHIFDQMTTISNEISVEWCYPPEDFQIDLESDSDYEGVFFGMEAIDKLIISIGAQHLLGIISNLTQKFFIEADWRYQHTAIMVLSQVAEHLKENALEITSIVDLVLSCAQNQNPKIRFAVCHCLGQLAEDLKPDFQKAFLNKVLPELMGMLNDPIRRVQSHSAAALTNFLEGLSGDRLQPYLTIILSRIYEILNNRKNAYIFENVINALAVTAETSGKEFINFYKDFVVLLFSIVRETTNNQANNNVINDGSIYAKTTEKMEEISNNKLSILIDSSGSCRLPRKSIRNSNLRGVIFECLTLIVNGIGRPEAETFLPQLIQEIITLEDLHYFISCWQRLTPLLKNTIGNHLQSILPIILNYITKLVDKDLDPDDEHPKEFEELQNCLSLLESFIDHVGSSILPYLHSILQINIPLASYQLNDEIRKIAIQLFNKIFLRFEEATQMKEDEKVEISRKMQFLLWEVASIESEPEILECLVATMKEIVSLSKYQLMDWEVTNLGKKMVKLVYDSDRRKDLINSGLENMEEDLDEEVSEEKINEEENLQIAIAQFLGILMKKTRKSEMTQKLAVFLFEEVIPKVCKTELSPKTQKFGLLLLVDILEFIGMEVFKPSTKNIIDILLTFSNSQDYPVKETATYGLGIISQNPEILPYLERIIGNLLENLKLSQQTKESLQVDASTSEKTATKIKIMLHCHDNITSTLGKYLFHFKNSLSNPTQVFWLWVQNLPILHDKMEAEPQHQFLCDFFMELVQNDAQINFYAIKLVVGILGIILDNKCSNYLRNSIRTLLFSLVEREKEAFFEIIDGLHTRQVIEKLLNEKGRDDIC